MLFLLGDPVAAVFVVGPVGVPVFVVGRPRFERHPQLGAPFINTGVLMILGSALAAGDDFFFFLELDLFVIVQSRVVVDFLFLVDQRRTGEAPSSGFSGTVTSSSGLRKTRSSSLPFSLPTERLSALSLFSLHKIGHISVRGPLWGRGTKSVNFPVRYVHLSSQTSSFQWW